MSLWDIYNSVVDTATNAYNAVVNYVAPVVADVQKAATVVYNQVANYATTLYNDAVTSSTNAANAVSSFVNTVYDAATNSSPAATTTAPPVQTVAPVSYVMPVTPPSITKVTPYKPVAPIPAVVHKDNEVAPPEKRPEDKAYDKAAEQYARDKFVYDTMRELCRANDILGFCIQTTGQQPQRMAAFQVSAVTNYARHGVGTEEQISVDEFDRRALLAIQGGISQGVTVDTDYIKKLCCNEAAVLPVAPVKPEPAPKVVTPEAPANLLDAFTAFINFFTGGNVSLSSMPGYARMSPLEQEQFRAAAGFEPGTETIGAAQIAKVFYMSLIGTSLQVVGNPARQMYEYASNKAVPIRIPDINTLRDLDHRGLLQGAMPVPLTPELATETFFDFAAMNGFNRSWATLLTALQTVIPDVSMSNEMRFRLRPGRADRLGATVFNEDEYFRLLSLNHISREYADRVKALSYTPLGIRQISTLVTRGVLSDADDIQNRYLDLGYLPEDAALLTASAVYEKPSAEKVLTRSFIEQEFDEGLINADELTAEYIVMGYSDVDAHKLTSLRTEKKIKAAAKEAERIKKAEGLGKKLSESATVAAYKVGIIGRDAALHKILRFGYNGDDAEILLQTADREINKPPKAVSTPAVKTYKGINEALNGYVNGEIDDAALIALLRGFNLDGEAAARLLTVAQESKASSWAGQGVPPA